MHQALVHFSNFFKGWQPFLLLTLTGLKHVSAFKRTISHSNYCNSWSLQSNWASFTGGAVAGDTHLLQSHYMSVSVLFCTSRHHLYFILKEDVLLYWTQKALVPLLHHLRVKWYFMEMNVTFLKEGRTDSSLSSRNLMVTSSWDFVHLFWMAITKLLNLCSF